MSARHNLTFEQGINLIERNQAGSCHRDLRDKFNISTGAVSNILKGRENI